MAQPDSVVEHFAVFNDDWLVGLPTLDLLGMIAYFLFVPTVLALYVFLRSVGQSVMAVAVGVLIIGIADFFATNIRRFRSWKSAPVTRPAESEPERAALVAAGQAMISMFNENASGIIWVVLVGHRLLH